MRPSTRVLQFRPASRSHGALHTVANERNGLEIGSATPLIGESGALTLLTRLRVAVCSSGTTSCGTPAIRRRGIARVALDTLSWTSGRHDVVCYLLSTV